MTGVSGQRAVKTSAWMLYTLIVLEILFMVSPFAAYYYSIYATPLNLLQDSPATAWLTMYLLPHFTYSSSWLANTLILVSWPLILVGIAVFLVGFAQVYWAKFTGKGAVAVGLYRHIRHPQYVALAIIGLGTSLYWSRFIVVIAFVTMLCIYVYLARVEERICLEKFGESYRMYMKRTGMFLPRRWENRLPRLGRRLPRKPWLKGVSLLAVYFLVLAMTLGAALWLRGHVIDSLQIADGPERVTVFLAPVNRQTRQVVSNAVNRNELPGAIAYVAPSSWDIPELGLTGTVMKEERAHLSELLHPTSHGNRLSFAETGFTVLLAEAFVAGAEVKGIRRFTRAIGIRPIEFIQLDGKTGEIVERRPAEEGYWAGIPVPTF